MPRLRFPVPKLLKAQTRRFYRNSDGATAVEFSFVALPFFAFMFAIIEAAMVFFAGQVLETATQDSARLILTGQAQSGNFTQAQFKQALCDRVYGLFDCTGGIKIDVKSYSSFSSIDLTNPIDGSGNFDASNLSYSPGSAGDIVVVRVYYQWPLFVTKLGFDLSQNQTGLKGKKLLVSTVAFRNEPF